MTNLTGRRQSREWDVSQHAVHHKSQVINVNRHRQPESLIAASWRRWHTSDFFVKIMTDGSPMKRQRNWLMWIFRKSAARVYSFSVRFSEWIVSISRRFIEPIDRVGCMRVCDARQEAIILIFGFLRIARNWIRIASFFWMRNCAVLCWPARIRTHSSAHSACTFELKKWTIKSNN